MKESLHIQITVESFMRHKVFDAVVLLKESLLIQITVESFMRGHSPDTKII